MFSSRDIDSFLSRKYFPFLLLIAFCAFTLFLYHQTIGCRIVTDALNWMHQYDTQGISGLRNCYGDLSLQYVYHAVNFLLFSIFGFHETGWYIVFSVLQALNCGLLFIMVSKILLVLHFRGARFIALMASILFLCSPYQTEVVVWAATIHYLLITCFFSLGIISLIRYADTGKKIFCILFHALFILALFSHSLAVCFSFIAALLVFLLYNKEKRVLRHMLRSCIFPQFILLVLYIILNKIFLGNFTGHAAGYTTMPVNILSMTANFNKYLLKDIFLIQAFPDNIRNWFYAFAENAYVTVLSLVLYVSLLFLFIKRYKNLKASLQFAGICIIIYVFALLPVLNLYFYHIIQIEADRLNYFSLFFSCILVAFMLNFLPWKLQAGVLIILVFISFHALHRNVNAWQGSAVVQQELEQNFTWETYNNIYILNEPDNFNGAYMYRDTATQTKLSLALQSKHKLHITNMISVMQYNMVEKTDSVFIEVLPQSQLKVSFAQWGNWFWFSGVGAHDYETEFVKVDVDDIGHSYTVTFKNRKPGDIYLYQCGLNWREIKGF